MRQLPALILASLSLLGVLRPSAAASEAEKAQEAFDLLYGDDLKRVAATRDPADDIALAAKLLEAAKVAQNQPAFLVLLCEKAVELAAIDPKGYETAAAAADLLAEKVPERAAACQEKVLTIRQRQYEAARGEDRTKAGEAFIQSLLAAAAAKARTGDFEAGLKHCRTAQAIARRIGAANTGAVEFQVRNLQARQKAAAKVLELKQQLQADPSNPPARDELVRILVVELDDPPQAAKHLDEHCDAALRKFVPAAAKPLDKAPELACVDLGEWYRGLADGAGVSPVARAAMLARAKAYYLRYLALHGASDIDRTKAELMVKKVDEALAKMGPAAADASPQSYPAGQWIDMMKLIDINRDKVAGDWQRSAAGLTLNAASGARLALPVIPMGSYELEYQFSRTESADAVSAMLPAGSSGVLLHLGGWVNQISGLSQINHRGADSNETKVSPPRIVNGRTYTVLIRVLLEGDQAAITITLDSRPYIAWQGAQSALWLPTGWALPNPKCIGLGGEHCRVVFSSIRLRMLSGQAVPREAAPAAAPAAPSSGKK